ncbi:MAG: AAA family ATPase, partial [Candidatus Hydrogenedentes bacterium]|nr:AAA family ATPase [Candidatus Hydrogenedentota bacterium]
MRITRIEISGFRNITHMVLTELTSGLLLTGRNGHGKSSVLDAVRYCLFGRCDHTDRSGRNAARMIGDGAREAQIQIRIQHRGRNIDVLTVLTQK